MKNVVSFETAKHLKESGFPQPEPEVGSVWYEESRDAYVVSRIKDSLFFGRYFYAGSIIEECSINVIAGDIYAPTATDILAEMNAHDIGYYSIGAQWIVFNAENQDVAHHANPAEAAALAWLKLHGK